MPAYRLTESLLAEYGGAVVCLDARAVGRRFRLHEKRPGAELNERVTSADIAQPDSPETLSDSESEAAITIVRIDGPIEQRAGYHDPCSGWTDGHDAIAERMIAGLEAGNVLMIVDSPGGAAAGAQEAIRRVLEVKEKYGRTVMAVADETIASGAFWWVCCVADEIYGPEAMRVGSIGARSGHVSEAGALKKAGVEVTYFTWPNDGKIAFAPEFPLTEEGRRRGERDIKLIGETFADAVSASRGISRKDIVRLSADVLSGQDAVDAGLVDGIASIEDVTGFLLALASNEQEKEMTIQSKGARTVASAPAVRTEEPSKSPDKMRSEDDEDKDKKDETEDEKKDEHCEDDEKDEKKDETEEDDEKKDETEEDGEDKKDETEDDEDDEETEEEDEKKDEKKEEKKTSLAAILGLRENASQPAIKSAVLAYVRLGKAVMTATSTNTPNVALGALQTIVDDAAETAKLRAENKSMRRADRERERKSLLLKLASANVAGYRRGDLFIDSVDEKTGAKTTAIAPAFAEMKLSTLRGLVNSKLASATASPRSPFEPSTEGAKEAQKQVNIDEAKASPVVKNAATFSSASEEQLAATYAALTAQGAK